MAGASPSAGRIAYSETVSPTLKSANGSNMTPCVCEPQLARTLTARGDGGPCVDRGQNVVAVDVHPAIAGTLCASGAGLSRPAGMGSEIDLCIAAVDCRNLKEVGDMSGTLQAKNSAGYSLNYQNPVRTGYIVRRLTPTECERLMSLEDGYTRYGHDGKEMSDCARYQMLGNSIVANCLAYIFAGIVREFGGGADE
jgi:DNA (cytosine-5)-methyltransferase 1